MKTQNALGVTCRACTPEQLKTLTSNVATTLAFRFLRPADDRDREDAFDGLVALCLKARRNLCILPTWSEEAQGKTWFGRTHEFIEDFVLAFFNRYKGQTEEQILLAALNNKFRYIGHKLQGAMVDEIRRRTALKNQEPWHAKLDSASEVSAALDYQGMQSSNVRTPLEFLKKREASLTEALGTRHYEVMTAAAESFPQAFTGTDQESKSALTRAIQRRRGVSEQQARADKRELLTQVSEEMQSGNRDLNDLHEFLARGDDEHTLRESYVSRDGRRKRSIRLRIELPHKPFVLKKDFE